MLFKSFKKIRCLFRANIENIFKFTEDTRL